MDIFSEQLVVRKKNMKDIGIIVGILILTLIISVLLTALLESLSFVLVCGTWFGAWWLITNRSTEFEYIMTSSVLDVDKIMAKRSRKRLLSLDLKEAESFMPIENMKNASVKIIDATPNGIEDGVYGIDFTQNGDRKRLLFKPNAEILNSARTACPKLVVLKRYDVEEQN